MLVVYLAFWLRTGVGPALALANQSTPSGRWMVIGFARGGSALRGFVVWPFENLADAIGTRLASGNSCLQYVLLFSLRVRLVFNLWPNYSDHAHLGRIDEHDLIIHLSELVGLCFRVGGEDVVR